MKCPYNISNAEEKTRGQRGQIAVVPTLLAILFCPLGLSLHAALEQPVALARKISGLSKGT